MRIALVIVGLVLSAGLVAAQESLSAHFFLRPMEHLLQPGQAVYWVEAPALQAVAMLPLQELRLRDFPIGRGEEGELALRRVRSVVDGQTQWWRGVRPARNGEPEVLEPAPGIVQYVFAGNIAGEPGSRVVLSIVGGELYGWIQRANGQLFQLVPTGQRWAETREHILAGATADELPLWTCAVEQMPEYWEWLRTAKEPSSAVPQQTTLRQARVAVEATSTLYLRFNRDYDRVAAYIASVFAMVSRIYEDEVNVTFVLPWVLIWMAPPDGDADPYSSDESGDLGSLLSEVRTYWNTYRPSVARDLVHVMAAPGTTMVGGIAQINSLCSRASAYSISGIRGTYSYPTLQYTWDVHVVAHEIGHVFGAPHTHACYWNPPLDTCVTQDGNPYPTPDACYRSPIQPHPAWDGGSIMSYCHLVQPSVVLTFRPRVVTVIRNSRAEACLAQPSSPVVLLQYPVGNQQLRGGQTVEIRWTSAQVQQVALQYSTDSMRTWNGIAAGIPAAQRVYPWQPPRQNIPAVWLRIYDVANPQVGDTTMASFSVAVPTLQLNNPRGGERYGRGEQVNVEWSSILVSSVNLLFSASGGQGQWDTVARALSGSSYRWSVPAVVTDRAVLRVEDATDASVFSQSQPFSIGIPVLRLLSPNGGERWSVGSQQAIRWESDFVSRVRIEYSTDGGQSWRLIRATYDATQQSYQWQVPNTPTENALVRLRNLGDTSQVVQSAAPFAIVAGGGTAVPVASQASVRVELRSPVAQGGWLWVWVRSSEGISGVHMRVLTLLGQVVHEVRWESVAAGDHLLPIALPGELAQGVYVLHVRTATGQWVLPFQCVR